MCKKLDVRLFEKSTFMADLKSESFLGKFYCFQKGVNIAFKCVLMQSLRGFVPIWSLSHRSFVLFGKHVQIVT